MKLINLTKGLQAKVDDDDYERVNHHKWYADIGRWNTYAKNDSLPGRPRMHVFIMQPLAGMVVHHLDKNGLNCQKENLEVTNQMTNARFTKLRRNKKGSKYRGVYKHGNGFTAEFWAVYKKHYLGFFKNEEDAALAYNKFAEEYLGEGNYEPNIIDLE
jgi:hypothetical protein